VNNSEKVKNRIISLILSFLLSVFLLVTSTTLVINGFILSGDGVIGSLREVNYHESAYVQIRETIGDRLIPTNLPHSIIDDAFTPYAVYTDLNDYLTYMFANELPNLQRESIAEIVNYNIDYYLQEIGRTRTEVGYAAIDEIVEMVIDNYNDFVGTMYLAYMARVSNLLRNHMLLLIATGLLGILVTSVIIYSINRSFKFAAFRYFAFSFGTTALMVIVAPLALRLWGGHHGLRIMSERTYDFIVTHIERTISVFLLVGTIFVALYFIFIFISARLQKKYT
jgi:hypothetical protein